MDKSQTFVGRKEYLEHIDQFINRWDPPGQVMLVVGDAGMGKTALLQAIAMQAATQKHVVVIGEIDEKQSDFSEQIYPLIAQVTSSQHLKMGNTHDWLKTGLSGFAITAGIVFSGAAGVLAQGIKSLGDILNDIRKRHQDEGSSHQSLSALFSKELTKRNEVIGGSKRIVIILDPEKESPKDIIPLLRQISSYGMPSKVRFIIAQRKTDTLIKAYNDGECDSFCHKPLKLEYMDEQDKTDLIATRDMDSVIPDDIRATLHEKYEGWPLLLEQAIEELLTLDHPVTSDDIEKLPGKIEKFWERRYKNVKNENVLKVIHTVCLLPHPYPVDRIAEFAALPHESVITAKNHDSLYGLLDTVSYENTLDQQLWDNCLAPKHATAKDYVATEISKNKSLKHELMGRIVTHYQNTIGDDLMPSNIDKDALVYLPEMAIENADYALFLSEIDRLGEIKKRYGLLDSWLSDLTVAHKIDESLGNKEGMANDYGNMGIVYQTRGDLDKALEMYEKALKINESIGRKEGMANQYGNMGIVYQTRGDLDKALEMYEKSLKINESLGSKEGMAIQYGNMGLVYQTRGDLNMALEMHEKALAIDEDLGSKEGMASDYGNMGIVYQIRGDLDMALEMYEKSLKLFKSIGAVDRVNHVQSLINNLPTESQ